MEKCERKEVVIELEEELMVCETCYIDRGRKFDLNA